MKNSTSITLTLTECSANSVQEHSCRPSRTQEYPVHLDVSPFEFFSRFGGSVYDRHCPAGASVVVLSSGCRRPTNGRGFMTSTRSVQHPQRAEGITSSSTLGSQSVPARDHQHATVLHCTLRAFNVCGDTETGLTQPPYRPLRCHKRWRWILAGNVLPLTPVCAQSVVHVLDHAGDPFWRQFIETRDNHARLSQM